MAGIRLYAEYLRTILSLAAKGTINGAFNWGPIVGAGLVGGVATLRGVNVIFSADWEGVIASTVVYSGAAWLFFFIFRLLFVAPYQLWRSVRRPPSKEKLQEFYVALSNLRSRNFDKASPDIAQQIDAYAAETSAVCTGAATWIGTNLGVAARTRFLDKSGMLDADIVGAANQRHSNIMLNIDRFLSNLREMIENGQWS